MNNFTKDELGLILFAISELVLINDEDSEKSPLYKKIHSLIDNYCEHKSDGYDYFKIAEDETIVEVLEKRKFELKCKHCEALYYDS